MANKWSREQCEIAVETIERMGVNLTPWEESFVESLGVQLGLGREPSEKQCEILERIYAEKTP